MGKHSTTTPLAPRPAVDFLSVDWLTEAATSHRTPTRVPAAAAMVGTAAVGLVLLPTGPMAVANASVPSTVSAPAATATVAATVAPAAGSYTVVAGDTLSKIGRAQGVAWTQIASANRIAAPWTIYPGQRLSIPSGGAPAIPTPAPAAAATTAAVTPVVASGAASSAGAKAVAVALAQVGDPYVWAATGPNAFDCSGLTSYAWAAAGVSLPRTSSAQSGAGVATTRSQLQPGDLIFYYSPISHVAMYIGGGQVVQAANESQPVEVTSIDWAGAPVAYRHIG